MLLILMPDDGFVHESRVNVRLVHPKYMLEHMYRFEEQNPETVSF